MPTPSELGSTSTQSEHGSEVIVMHPITGSFADPERESAFRSARKYACVILAIVILHLAIGIGLSVLSSNSWTLAGGVVAFILNIVSTSMVLCCSRKEDARRLCAVVIMAIATVNQTP